MLSTGRMELENQYPAILCPYMIEVVFKVIQLVQPANIATSL